MHRAWASSLPLSWNSASTACTPHQQRILCAPNEINKGVFSAERGVCLGRQAGERDIAEVVAGLKMERQGVACRQPEHHFAHVGAGPWGKERGGGGWGEAGVYRGLR